MVTQAATSQPRSLDREATQIGWIGTGVMGSSMAAHLIDAGYRLVVYNRSLEKTQPLVQRGATLADSPRDLAQQSDIIFSIVGYPSDVRQVILGESSEDPSVISGLRPGAIVVDMTTSQPTLAVEIEQAIRRAGGRALDAPVSGGDIGAKAATLSIMVGGDPETYHQVLPLLERMGKTIVFQGPAGSGQHAKMVNQTLVAASMIGVCEALLYAQRAGLDMPTVLKSVSSGAAGSWALTNLAPRIVAGDYAPGFYVEHFLKDMQIVLEEAARMKLAMPGLALVNQLYNAVAAQGHARSGTQALIVALKKLSSL